jgi:hypothetical protein
MTASLVLVAAAGILLRSVAAAPAANGDWTVEFGADTSARVLRQGAPFADLAPGAYSAGWQHAGVGLTEDDLAAAADGEPGGTIHTAAGPRIACRLEVEDTPAPDTARLRYTLTPAEAVALNSLHVSLDIPAEALRDAWFRVDATEPRPFPAALEDVHLVSAVCARVEVGFSAEDALIIEFAEPTPVLIQDNRRWGPSFSVRVGPQLDAAEPWPAGRALELDMTLRARRTLRVTQDRPVTMAPGPDWHPLPCSPDIEPGSILDFSGFGFVDPPAGKHGWLRTGTNGHLEFAGLPGVPQRFYGVNLCFSAQFLDHSQADVLAERLRTLGYNSVRFHHYESGLIDQDAPDSLRFLPEALDRFDYLFAALRRRGLYLTTDLYVSRPVKAAELWEGDRGTIAQDAFKMLVLVHPPALENWKAFARNLLTHRNPYSGLAYAEDPALAWIALVNEGTALNFTGRMTGPATDPHWKRPRAVWEQAWGRWLHREYRVGDGSPAPLPGNGAPDTETRRFHRFAAERERLTAIEMRRFLREELGVQALLTNQNGWATSWPLQTARDELDYVDEHFYYDHPEFLIQPWRLPSRTSGLPPLIAGWGGPSRAFSRIWGKPFTLSEFNFSAPSPFRSSGGLLTGALACVQDWDVVWRFAYSHNRGNLFEPAAMNYFDLAADPLNLITDRLSLCLFLRRDLPPAPAAVVLELPRETALAAKAPLDRLPPAWQDVALQARVGTRFLEHEPEPDTAVPMVRVTTDLGRPGDGTLLGPAYDAAAGDRVRDAVRTLSTGAGTGLRLDPEQGRIELVTPGAVACALPAGHEARLGPVRVRVMDSAATVFVISTDAGPLSDSSSLLVAHLTDVQNTGARFLETGRRTLLDWGTLRTWSATDGSSSGSIGIAVHWKASGQSI